MLSESAKAEIRQISSGFWKIPPLFEVRVTYGFAMLEPLHVRGFKRAERRSYEMLKSLVEPPGPPGELVAVISRNPR